MLSSFASSIKKFVFGRPVNANEVSRKRGRDENDEVDGQNGDELQRHLSSSPKKLKTGDLNSLQIRGITSGLRAKMADVIMSQKQRKAASNERRALDNSYRSSSIQSRQSEEFQGLVRPPLHHLSDITCMATNGTSDHYDIQVEQDIHITQGVSNRNLTNGHTESQPDSGTNYQTTLGLKWQTPAAQSKTSTPFRLNTSQSEQFRPMYDKTFNSSQNSSFTIMGRRACSFNQKRQLEERDRYKHLLQQFSNFDLSKMCAPSQISSRSNQSIFSVEQTNTKPPHSREVSVITLDSPLSPTSPLNKSTGRQKVPVITLDSKLSETSALNKSTLRRSEMFSTPRPVPEKLTFKESPNFSKDWAKEFKEKYSKVSDDRARRIVALQERINNLEEQRLVKGKEKQQRLEQRLLEAKQSVEVVEEDEIEEEAVDKEFPELTLEMEEEIDSALAPHPPGEILAEGFNIQIKRRDMITLAGLNWLNDEIINFYMNLLVDRGGKEDNDKVHAFNTFFYPKLTSSGYSSIRRWTKKTNIFEKQYLLIPIHLGMHWCLATVDFKKKAVNYYDSMRGKNPKCLAAIRQYLCDESLDKRKTEFDLTGWTFQEIRDIPEQLNGSDCGMFTCKYAEYITRGVPITFTQKHMPYFRRRMVYEILQTKLF